jgi:hypothetical protein
MSIEITPTKLYINPEFVAGCAVQDIFDVGDQGRASDVPLQTVSEESTAREDILPCKPRRGGCLRKKSSFCNSYAGESSPSAQSQSAGAPFLDRTLDTMILG